MERSINVIGYQVPMAVALVSGLTILLSMTTGLLRFMPETPVRLDRPADARSGEVARVVPSPGATTGAAERHGSPDDRAGSRMATDVLPPLPWAALFFLVPGLVLDGQVWRLVTWAFLALDPISLLFAVAAQSLWFGNDLCWRWGWRRFLAVYFGFALAIGTLITLASLALRPLQIVPFGTAWAVLTALIVGWAIVSPGGQMRFMLFIPASGRQILWIMLALIVVGAALNSPLAVLPEFVAFVLALVYFREPMLWRFFAGFRRRSEPPRRTPNPNIRIVDSDPPARYH